MTSEQQYLLFAKCVLRDCPQFLSDEMVAALVRAGMDLPDHLRAKFSTRNTNPKAEVVRHPMNDP